MVHTHSVVPSDFSCLISFLRSHSAKLRGVKISIVLGTEGGRKRPREVERTWGAEPGSGLAFQSPVLSRPPWDCGELQGHPSVVLPLPCPAPPPAAPHLFLPGEIGLKCVRSPLEVEKKSHRMSIFPLVLFPPPLSLLPFSF